MDKVEQYNRRLSAVLRRHLAFVCILLGLASPALAQTTFTSGDCNANITITGAGLTLTSTQTGNFVGCRASVGKQSGLPYYEATVNHAPVATVFGVAGGGAGTSPTASAWWSTAAGVQAGNTQTAAVMGQDGNTFWNNVRGTGGTALVSGKTVGLAFNLNTDPWAYWATNDVTNLVCNGSGSSGSTSPKWNGTCASDPSLPGTGNPIGVFPSGSTAGTGSAFFIPGGAVWPIWQGEVLDSATFNFGAASFVGTIPSGFTAWNNSSGNTAYPGPINPLLINVSNAPGFLISTAYTSGNRVNAGAGWNGSAYTSGLPVCVFGLVTPGTSGTDPTVFNTACASGTPSNTGGIPGGSWPGATTVTSGGATFALLSRIDYATNTGAFSDTSVIWAPSTQYPGISYVRNGSGCASGGSPCNLYLQQQLFADPATCVSGTGSGPPASDGTCHWVLLGALTYSSNANIWPTMQFFGANSAQFNFNVKIVDWYGGSAQQIYGPQQPGEALPTLMAYHDDLPQDQGFYCKGGYGISGRSDNCMPYITNFTVAPGDSFADNFTTSTPLRIDQTKGVTITNTMTWVGYSGSFVGSSGEPIGFSDNAVAISRFQLESVNGMVLPAHDYNGPGNQHMNNMQVSNSILQSGANGSGGVFCDAACSAINSVLIVPSTASGSVGIEFGYQNMVVANDIIVGVGATNSTCVSNRGQFANLWPTVQYNNLCVGFPNPWATGNGVTWTFLVGSNNATDAPAGGYGGTFADANGNTLQSGQLPGVNTSTGCGVGQASPCSGLTAANQLVNPTPGGSFDGRIKTGADIIGAGFLYSTAGALLGGGTATNVTDIIGQAWAASPSRYDIGPEKFLALTPACCLGLHFGFARP